MLSKDLEDQTYSPSHLTYLSSVKRYQRNIKLSQVALLVGFILLWELVVTLRWIDPFFTSKPSAIFALITRLVQDGSIFKHTAVSVTEAVIAFVIGTLLGTVLATALWWSEFVARVLDPYLVVLHALPKIALGPIIIIWAGAGMRGIIVTALMISLVVTILSTYNGYKEVDEEKVKMLQTFGATKLQIFQKVIFPASIPTMINTMKINIGMTWVGVIVGEFLVSKAGLGYLIVYGGQVFRLDIVMAGVIILAIATAIMYQLIVWLEYRFLKGRQ
ncbi:binding-protein-dependent transport systems inner membrane component [Alkaliphilus metalliredigens QYMF]|uniref:Binding-protein-dependent transport systems inner membrane component n=1 Tax=Alkaliphilus metalliredigens (strain QYMF) TaxID=293826 RepID=A6TMR4_ALKMQ|nr:ABC transporter permease [Alkaliphilus metalliredigens]ABR47482.1 binding-protein-dependent transport systems inner membrane component [Alkaliphilus metalliredigens QYMF]